MSGDTPGETEVQARLGCASTSVGALRLPGVWDQMPPDAVITEMRRPAASLRRDVLFRPVLPAADIVAIAEAFLLMTRMFPRPLELTWLSIVGLSLLIIGVKLFGLHDRNDLLCKKTIGTDVDALFLNKCLLQRRPTPWSSSLACLAPAPSCHR